MTKVAFRFFILSFVVITHCWLCYSSVDLIFNSRKAKISLSLYLSIYKYNFIYFHFHKSATLTFFPFNRELLKMKILPCIKGVMLQCDLTIKSVFIPREANELIEVPSYPVFQPLHSSNKNAENIVKLKFALKKAGLYRIVPHRLWWIMKEERHLFWESWALKYLLKIRILFCQGVPVSSWAVSDLSQSQQEEHD